MAKQPATFEGLSREKALVAGRNTKRIAELTRRQRQLIIDSGGFASNSAQFLEALDLPDRAQHITTMVESLAGRFENTYGNIFARFDQASNPIGRGWKVGRLGVAQEARDQADQTPLRYKLEHDGERRIGTVSLVHTVSIDFDNKWEEDNVPGLDANGGELQVAQVSLADSGDMTLRTTDATGTVTLGWAEIYKSYPYGEASNYFDSIFLQQLQHARNLLAQA